MNFNEAIIHALIIEAKSIEVEVIGMQANDTHNRSLGDVCYMEVSYAERGRRLSQISNEIQQIAHEGYL